MEMKFRKQLSASYLIRCTRQFFQKTCDLQSEKAKISTVDCVMACFAVFSLKWASLLHYEKNLKSATTLHNFKSLYGITSPPSDTHMRRVLDLIDPSTIQPIFKKIFSIAQRGKDLEAYQTINGHYLISIDGTGMFSSHKIHCKNCCQKNHRNGTTTYQHNHLMAVMVGPGLSPVIPLDMEPIVKQDGEKKNDCELNANQRLLPRIRRQHPHLKIMVVEDGLYGKGPHLQQLRELGMSYIIGVKSEDHQFLFDWVRHGEKEHYEHKDTTGTTHIYNYINQVPLNDKHSEMKVNFLDYWEIKKGKKKHFTWITNIQISRSNCEEIMRGGRARWRIENETFNTLKNQGYNFQHNYGHGHENLCTVMSLLMLLAFTIDQVQLLGCKVYQEAKKSAGTWKGLWEETRALFIYTMIESWDIFLMTIATRQLVNTS